MSKPHVASCLVWFTISYLGTPLRDLWGNSVFATLYDARYELEVQF